MEIQSVSIIFIGRKCSVVNVSIVCMVNDKMKCAVFGVKNIQKKCSDEKVGVQKETPNSNTSQSMALF